MILIKTKPRYRCDFCNHAGTEPHMKVHEGRCWKNPNRYCEWCHNTGTEDYGIESLREPCRYCKKFEPDIAKRMEESQ